MRTRKLSIGAALFFCLFLSYSRGALQSLSLYFDKTNFTRHHYSPSIGLDAGPRRG